MKKNEITITEEVLEESLANDILKRKKILNNLIILLNSIDDNYTMSIDGEWGSGKTFLINQLLYLYENDRASKYVEKDSIEEFRKKYVPVYYNAWENDDSEDALQSILYQTLDTFSKYKNDILNVPQQYDKIIKPVLENIISTFTFGIFDKEVFDKIKSFEELADKIVTKEELKKSLYSLFDAITPNDSRILLIIDDLDRCNPSYAVSLLETIKHFYNYKKITCLVITNNSQLSECVKHFYGDNFDGYSYLNRIYDTVLTLKNEDLDGYYDHYLYFGKISEGHEYFQKFLMNFFKMNLRECNTYAEMIRISTKYINARRGFGNKYYSICTLLFLPVAFSLKIKNINDFNDFIEGNNEKILIDLLKYAENNEQDYVFHMIESALKMKDDESTEKTLIDCYKDFFTLVIKEFDSYPFYEAISLLGNMISYKE